MRVLVHSAAFCVTRVVDARPRLHPSARDLTPLKTTPCRRGAALANALGHGSCRARSRVVASESSGVLYLLKRQTTGDRGAQSRRLWHCTRGPGCGAIWLDQQGRPGAASPLVMS